MTATDDALTRLANLLQSATHAVAFTGAGISTESGIPDFRSPGGVWSRYKPVTLQDFLASHEARQTFWKIRRESYADFVAARPNAGHAALARLEAAGRLAAVITQNIDELHQQAGSKRVLELHGTARQVVCISCEKRWPASDIQQLLMQGVEVPTCDDCGGWLKSATISFGQQLPAEVLAEATRISKRCDLFLAIGSSLVVQPAAMLPVYARQAGATLIIINNTETPLDDVADLVIRGPIGETLARATRHIARPAPDPRRP